MTSSNTARLPRIVLLTELFPPAVGGTPVLFEAIYSRLRRTPVTVLTDDIPLGPHDGPRRDALDVIRRPIGMRAWGLLDVDGLRGYARVVRELRRLGGGGVIHCGRVMPEGVAAWLNRLAGGPPYVCWAHGEEIVTAEQSREFNFLASRVYGGAAANIVNSENTRRMLEARGTPSAAIRVVHPGVDVDRFRPDVDGAATRARYAREGELVLLSVGRLQRRKGHDLVIEAVSRLAATTPVQYLIAGAGEEQPRLQRLASELGVAARVHFLGEVANAELPVLYAACDVFVMPNRVWEGDIEGFGIVFLEAAATARPAIGGRSGGVAEAVDEGRTGLLVGGTDAEELAAAIRRLAESPETRRALGEAGRTRVRERFTWDRAAAEVEALHEELVARLRLL